MKKAFFLILLFVVVSVITADVYIDPKLECCNTTNQLISQLMQNASEVSIGISKNETALKEINKSINNINESINKVNEPRKDNDCNLCNIFGAILGAVISGLAAIFVFWLTDKKEKRRKSNTIRGFGRAFFELVDNVTRKFTGQITLLKEYVKIVKETPYKINALNFYEFTQSERIHSFDSALVFQAFEELKLDKHEYSKFYSNFDYLNKVTKLITSDYNKLTDQISTFGTEFIKVRIEILNQCAIYNERKRKEKKTDDPLYVFLNKLLLDYHKSLKQPDEPDLNKDMDLIINPMKNSLLDEFREYEITEELLLKLQ